MPPIEFTLNGKPQSLSVDGQRNLLWVLRGELGLTGTKYGCGEGVCGACTVVVNNEPMRACQLTMADVRGKEVLTIEGLARGEKLHPLQEQFIEHGGMQCGFCTSGMIMNAYGMLAQKPSPSREEIIAAMDDNLCRCGAHKRILEAIQAVAGRK